MEHTSLGTIQILEGKKRFVPHSVPYHHQGINRFSEGAKVRATYKEVKREHSRPQHNYHFALCGLISDHTGYTVDDVHDAMMKLTFGTRSVSLLGREFEARESISSAAQMSSAKAQELINKDLEVCADLEIRVPTMKELGLISNY